MRSRQEFDKTSNLINAHEKERDRLKDLLARATTPHEIYAIQKQMKRAQKLHAREMQNQGQEVDKHQSNAERFANASIASKEKGQSIKQQMQQDSASNAAAKEKAKQEKEAQKATPAAKEPENLQGLKGIFSTAAAQAGNKTSANVPSKEHEIKPVEKNNSSSQQRDLSGFSWNGETENPKEPEKKTEPITSQVPSKPEPNKQEQEPDEHPMKSLSFGSKPYTMSPFGMAPQKQIPKSFKQDEPEKETVATKPNPDSEKEIPKSFKQPKEAQPTASAIPTKPIATEPTKVTEPQTHASNVVEPTQTSIYQRLQNLKNKPISQTSAKPATTIEPPKSVVNPALIKAATIHADQQIQKSPEEPKPQEAPKLTAQPIELPTKRGRGRPKGSTKRPAEAGATQPNLIQQTTAHAGQQIAKTEIPPQAAEEPKVEPAKVPDLTQHVTNLAQQHIAQAKTQEPPVEHEHPSEPLKGAELVQHTANLAQQHIHPETAVPPKAQNAPEPEAQVLPVTKPQTPKPELEIPENPANLQPQSSTAAINPSQKVTTKTLKPKKQETEKETPSTVKNLMNAMKGATKQTAKSTPLPPSAPTVPIDPLTGKPRVKRKASALFGPDEK